MAIKKLEAFQVLRAYSRRKEHGQWYRTNLRFVEDPPLIEGKHAPENCFCVAPNKIILPKKARGEKFEIVYLTAHTIEL